MKKLICCLLLLSLLLPCVLASAEPRFPRMNGPVTDAAAVLDLDTVQDLAVLRDEIVDEAGFELFVVTVDFLDGMPGQQYADGLFRRWMLDEGDLLVLLAVGEDTWFTAAGSNILLSSTVLNKLLTTHLAPPFLAQRYDEAIAAFAPALADEVNKTYACRVSAAGLFGLAAEQPDAVPTAAPKGWGFSSFIDRSILFDDDDFDAEAYRRDFDRQTSSDDRRSGIGLGTILLVLILLSLVAKSDKRARRRGRRSLGSFLAWGGLFYLLSRLFGKGSRR